MSLIEKYVGPVPTYMRPSAARHSPNTAEKRFTILLKWIKRWTQVYFHRMSTISPSAFPSIASMGKISKCLTGIHYSPC